MLAAALGLLLLQATTEISAPSPYNSPRFDACVSSIDRDANAAYEAAMAWANEAEELPAFHCAALALIGQNRHQQGARRLESLAYAAEGQNAGLRASLLSQAGHAWLLANEPLRARGAFTRAITTLGAGNPGMADALVDRAVAYSLEGNPRAAEEDLSRALDLQPDNPVALRLRAMARMKQNALDLAVTDAETALRLAPGDVESALVLGHVREAQRVGHPIDETYSEPDPSLR